MPIDHTDFVVTKAKKKERKPNTSADPGRYWWEELTEYDMAQAAFTYFRGVKMRQADLRSEYLFNSRFLGDRDNLLQAGAATIEASGAEYLPDNVVLEVIETRESSVTVNRPRPAFLTSGGNFRQQQKARALNKFCAGAFYENAVDELARLVRRDDEKCGIGTAKVYVEDGRIKVERVLPYENIVDEIEAKYRKPVNRAHVKTVPRHRLLKDYAEGEDKTTIREMLLGSGVDEVLTPLSGYGSSQALNLVTVMEVWHLPSGKDADDGVWALFVNKGCLFKRPWKLTMFPLVDHITDPPYVGYRGKGMVEQLIPDQVALNEILIDEKDIRQRGVPKWLYPSGARIREEDVDDEILSGIEYDGPTPPSIAQGAAVPESFVRRKEEIRQSMYRKGRVSEMAVQNQKPAGLDSAPSQRTFEDITQKRMSKDFQAWEKFHMDLARAIVETARDFSQTEAGEKVEDDDRIEEGEEDDEAERSKRKGGYKVRSPGANSYDEVEWGDIDLAEEDYVIQATPISSLPNTWSGRLQSVVERIQMGWMSQEEGMLKMEMPDTEASTNMGAAGLQNALWTMSRMIEKGIYRQPEPYNNLEAHHEVALAVYNWAQANNYPENRLSLVRQYIDAVVNLTPPPPPAPAPMGPPMPAGPVPGPSAMGLPPGGPMPQLAA